MRERRCGPTARRFRGPAPESLHLVTCGLQPSARFRGMDRMTPSYGSARSRVTGPDDENARGSDVGHPPGRLARDSHTPTCRRPFPARHRGIRASVLEPTSGVRSRVVRSLRGDLAGVCHATRSASDGTRIARRPRDQHAGYTYRWRARDGGARRIAAWLAEHVGWNVHSGCWRASRRALWRGRSHAPKLARRRACPSGTTSARRARRGGAGTRSRAARGSPAPCRYRRSVRSAWSTDAACRLPAARRISHGRRAGSRDDACRHGEPCGASVAETCAAGVFASTASLASSGRRAA